jgi:hypothetical protein
MTASSISTLARVFSVKKQVIQTDQTVPLTCPYVYNKVKDKFPEFVEKLKCGLIYTRVFRRG